MGWEYPPAVDLHFTTANDERRQPSTGTGESALLKTVTINTPSANAILTIYKGPYPNNGTPSTTGTKVATIACDTKPPTTLEYNIRCPGGVYAQMTGGNADVTVAVV